MPPREPHHEAPQPAAEKSFWEKYGIHGTIVAVSIGVNIIIFLTGTGWLSAVAKDSDLQAFKAQVANQFTSVNEKIEGVKSAQQIMSGDIKYLIGAVAEIKGAVIPRRSADLDPPTSQSSPAPAVPRPAAAQIQRNQRKVQKAKPPVRQTGWSLFR
jgi:hypothetical protein